MTVPYRLSPRERDVLARYALYPAKRGTVQGFAHSASPASGGVAEPSIPF